MKIYYDHQLCLLFQLHVCEIDRFTKVNKRSIPILIQLMYNKNDHLAKQSIFDVFFWLLKSLFPLDPRRPLHMLCMFKATCHCPKGILGLGGGGASKNKLKGTSFTFPVTNVTVLSIFCTHAQDGYCKVLEIKNSKAFTQSLV